jgi:hypothetical protein
MLRFFALAAGVVALTALAKAEPAPPAATIEPVMHRFLARADEPLMQYRGTRRLEGRSARLNLDGWMEVATELEADGFHYRVVREGGSDMIRRRVFRSILDNEERLFATRDARRSSFTADNYELTPANSEEAGLVKLLAHPRRRDVTLIDGAVFVTDTDADLVRVEGRLAQNPSFWTKRVEVVKQYQRIGGLRVPVRVDSTAQMRLAGTSTLTMTYDYDMINGVVVASSHSIAALSK